MERLGRERHVYLLEAAAATTDSFPRVICHPLQYFRDDPSHEPICAALREGVTFVTVRSDTRCRQKSYEEFKFGNEAEVMAPAGTRSGNTFEVFLTRLRESHDVSVYEAIERFTHAGEAVGFEVSALIKMLDRGTTFEELLALIESRMERSQKAA